ncbi:MAG: DUF5309 domain-containing protein [Gallionella sp.]|jgi:hypothetical protein|nr:DUF5309 domain-containing protein [Gallionella sp.]
MAFGQSTYTASADRGVNDRKESLLSILKDVSPNEDNYFVSNLGQAPAASNTLHEWVTYNTARPTSYTGTIEGAAASYSDLTAPTRTANVTDIVTETVRVSGTMRAISTATGEDPYTFQKGEAIKRLKAKMEYITINGAMACGSSGVARTMTGFDQMISTNVTARASGTSFTETELNDIMQDVWTQVGSEYIADVIVAPIVIKRRIAGFTSNLTRMIQASEKRLTNEIRVYDTQVGQSVMVLAHKDVRSAAGTLTVYALREDTWKHSFLKGREPQWEELAKDGDRDNGQYVTELTLVGYAQLASAKRTGYATTL